MYARSDTRDLSSSRDVNRVTIIDARFYVEDIRFRRGAAKTCATPDERDFGNPLVVLRRTRSSIDVQVTVKQIRREIKI